MQEFDVLVIGAGPGGYVAAKECGMLGLKTACVDNFVFKEKYSLGGTCLNVGCIPSKILLQSSEHFHHIEHEFKDHGISCSNPTIDIKKMISRKDELCAKNAHGISFLFRKYKVEELHGSASFVEYKDGKYLLNVDNFLDKKQLQVVAKHVIIATGSVPRQLSQIDIDNNIVLDNQGALDLTAVPKTMCVIGAGVIGLELGSVWSRLGTKVTILDVSDKFLRSADEQIATELLKQLTNQGLEIISGVKIGDINKTDTSVTVNYTIDGKVNNITTDKLLVSIGRVPFTKGLNLDNIGLKIENNGCIPVNEYCQTQLPNLWAIGDCTRGVMLAHKASAESKMVAERILGQKTELNYQNIPFVIYTNPELAWVGFTEQELVAKNIEYKKGVSYFMSNGRAMALGTKAGFVKILVCAKTDRVLGAHMIGPFVSEILTEIVLAMEFYASSEDIARVIHSHPSLSEVVQEAAAAIK
jgi:dihydrolipoamide dehydrogenase